MAGREGRKEDGTTRHGWKGGESGGVGGETDRHDEIQIHEIEQTDMLAGTW